MRFRVFDIETVPDLTVWTPGDTQFRLVAGSKHPDARYGHLGATEGVLMGDGIKDAHQPLVVPTETFPPPQAHRVVAIASLDIGFSIEPEPKYRSYTYLSCEAACRWSHDPLMAAVGEMVLLKKFADDMANAEEDVNLVSWNGRCFDLPVMSMRALHLGVPWGWYYAGKDLRYRYSTEGHLDLMDFLADFGAAKNMKLGDAARLIGLPGKVGPVSGATVRDEYQATLKRPEEAASRMAAVQRYCLADVVQTALLFLRTRFHFGKVTASEYNLALETFQEKPEINTIIDINWDALKL